jgi:hypothetical protein
VAADCRNGDAQKQGGAGKSFPAPFHL